MTTPLRKNRDFQLLWAGQAVSMLGSRVSQIAYPLLVLAMTGSAAAAGLVGFVGTLPYILFQLPAGALMDRVDRRRVMIGCDLVRLAALGSIPLVAWLGALRLAQVMVVALVEGTMFVLFRLGEVSAIRIIVPSVQYPAALSQNEVRLRTATLLGNPVGGFLFDLGRTSVQYRPHSRRTRSGCGLPRCSAILSEGSCSTSAGRCLFSPTPLRTSRR